MKLHQLAPKQDSQSIVNVMESYFEAAPKISTLTETAASKMLNRVQSLLSEFRATSKHHLSEQNPQYLKLVMLEQALSTKIDEYAGAQASLTPSAPSTGALMSAGGKPSVQAKKVTPGQIKTAANNPSIASDPALKGMLDKAAGGTVLSPDEAKSLAALVANTKLGEDEGGRKRIVKKLEAGGKKAVVYRDADWDEYIVRFYRNGKYQADADYHCDDQDDALGTATSWIGERSPMIENREYTIAYVEEDDVWAVEDSVGNRVESFIEKHEAVRAARKLNSGAPAGNRHRHVNSRDDQLDEISADAARKYRGAVSKKYPSRYPDEETARKRNAGRARAGAIVDKDDAQRNAANRVRNAANPQRYPEKYPLGGRDEKSGRSYSEDTTVNEISADLARDYKDSAELDLGTAKLQRSASKMFPWGSKKTRGELDQRSAKRSAGISRADRRLSIGRLGEALPVAALAGAAIGAAARGVAGAAVRGVANAASGAMQSSNEVEESGGTTRYAIKHRGTKKTLQTVDSREEADDTLLGLGADSRNYVIVPTNNKAKDWSMKEGKMDDLRDKKKQEKDGDWWADKDAKKSSKDAKRKVAGKSYGGAKQKEKETVEESKLKKADTRQLVEFYRKHRGTNHPSVKLVETELLRRKRVVESANKRGRKLISESEIQQAQVVLAAQEMVDQVQKMVEQASSTQYKDLPALVSQIRIDLGADQSAQFNQSATEAFQGLLQALQDTKNKLESAVGIVLGRGTDVVPPAAPVDAAMPTAADVDPDAAAADLDLDLDLGDETGDITGLGRERR